MSLIQPVLVAALAVVCVLFIISVRVRVVGRLLLLSLFASGVAFIVRPDLANRIAHTFGVGRGADLFLYLFGVFAMYAFVRIYARQHLLERKLTELTRSVALDEGRRPG